MGNAMLSSPNVWLVIGFTGQALFTARFVVQWLVSEKRRDSVVPVAFWWLSLLGGLTLLSYASYREDPVIMVGQGMGLVVYVRNLMLVNKSKRRAAKRHQRVRSMAPHGDGEHANDVSKKLLRVDQVSEG
jgi:lipid-A-disaccharide synthase-like uncharacterized protein